MNIIQLHDKIAAVAPIYGVSIGSPTDKSTWRIDYMDEATDAQKEAAQAVVGAFDPTTSVSVPLTVSSMQAKVALLRSGLLDQVNTWVASQSIETQLIWSSTPSFNRDSTLLNNAATAFNLTSDQVDALFVTAASISP